MEPVNETPFDLKYFTLFNKDAAETLIIILKATYELCHNQPPVIAEEQDPLNIADKYVAEPGQSGLLTECEFMPLRPTTGVTLTGHAVATHAETTAMNVSVQVGSAVQRAVVYGRRVWFNTLGFPRISKPKPFERISLNWENAFGGTDESPSKDKHKEAQPDNPVGSGFFARHSAKKVADEPLPNIEHPEHPIKSLRDRPAPVGFCPVAPSWQPRLGFAGTYDQKWQEQRAPLLPDDFDERFFQSAPPALTATGYFSGGEPCLILGATSQGRLAFNLPKIKPDLQIKFSQPSGVLRVSAVPVFLDTVHVDTDMMRLHLIWRGSKEVHGRLETIRAIEARVNVRE